MAGDEVIFSLVQEQGVFGLAPLSGMGTSWLEQAPLIRGQGMGLLSQEGLFPLLEGFQFWDSLKQDLSIGV